jgi:hypothetical protein
MPGRVAAMKGIEDDDKKASQSQSCQRATEHWAKDQKWEEAL